MKVFKDLKPLELSYYLIHLNYLLTSKSAPALTSNKPAGGSHWCDERWLLQKLKLTPTSKIVCIY